MKRLTFLLLALFLACEKDDETTTAGLASDEVAWLHVNLSGCYWSVFGTDDSLRVTFPGRLIYGEQGCEESSDSYALHGDSLILNPGAEDERHYRLAMLDSGRVLRGFWEDGSRRWYWDSTRDDPTDCAAYGALAGIEGEFVGTGILRQDGVTLDTLELRGSAGHGFLWLRAYTPTHSRLFTLGVRAQPGAGSVPMLAGASAYSYEGGTFYLDNGQLALASFSSAGVAGVFTGLFYDRDTNPSGHYDADISLSFEFDAVAAPAGAPFPLGQHQEEPWGFPAR